MLKSFKKYFFGNTTKFKYCNNKDFSFSLFLNVKPIPSYNYSISKLSRNITVNKTFFIIPNKLFSFKKEKMTEVIINLLKSFQVQDTVIKHVTESKKLCSKVEKTFSIANLNSGSSEVGNALIFLAEKLDETYFHRLPFVVEYIKTKKLLNQHQIEVVVDYLKTKGMDLPIDPLEFEKSVGIGQIVTVENIQKSIDEQLKSKKCLIELERYKFEHVKILNEVKKDFAYLDKRLALDMIVKSIEKLLGPKTEEELKEDNHRLEFKNLSEKKKKVKDSEKKKKENQVSEVFSSQEEARLEELKNLIKSYDDNFKNKIKNSGVDEDANKDESIKLDKIVGRDMVSALNTKETMEKHLAFTKGLVYTRFPPEPNGYLHIGHAKAMRFSFTSASKKGGKTYLRFDDTNPDKENNEFIENIKENVKWLGYEPFKITHASDYFDDLYRLAQELIRRGKAFVCNQSKEEISESRDKGIDSPYRNRSVEENLELFKKMKQGRFQEKECCLRMKIDMKHPNTAMRDPVAYRIKYSPHPHTGDKWCIYPTYDFTHSINDSLENITHSLCTLEFEVRRDNYYWLLEALDLYRPFVWEYSRLNISNFVMSKRRLQHMVENRIVRGWDDPRMPTINGLRRRGYTPEAINHFVDTVGVTRRGNENFVSIKLLENSVKLDLDKKASRSMAVVDPLEVKIVNLEETKYFKTPLFPKNKELGEREISLTNKIYIERKDFEEEAGEDYFGLTLKQEVGLKYSGILKVVKVNRDNDGKVLSLECSFSPEERQTKGRIHWISDKDKVQVEIRWYDVFFKSENPNSLGNNWMDDMNPDSEKIYRSSLVNKNIANNGLNVRDHFQFERLGYFVVDPDTKTGLNNFVFNLTVKL